MSITNINSILPEVIRGNILPLLEPKDLSAVARTSKVWNQHASSDTVWKPLFQKRFPDRTTTPISTVKEQYKTAKEITEDIAEFSPQYSSSKMSPILQLLGGAEEFRKLPVMALHHTTNGAPPFPGYPGPAIDYFTLQQLTSPIMRGKDLSGRHFLVIRIAVNGQPTAIGFRCYYEATPGSIQQWQVLNKYFADPTPYIEFLTDSDAESNLKPILNKTGGLILAD